MAALWHLRTEREKVVNGTGTAYRKNSPRRLGIAILHAVVALPRSVKAILKNKDQYHWRELPQVSLLSRQTRVCCRVFVATKIILVAAPANDKTAHKGVN